jgi:UDP-glucose 4-epimerase
MTAQPLTFSHGFQTQQLHSVFEAVGGIPVHESLDAATNYLESVVAGLRDLMSEPSVSNHATLIYFAADAALALVYSAHAGVAPAQGGKV